MTKRLRFAVLAGVCLIGLSAEAVTLARQPPAPRSLACLAIGAGVCFSGTTEWVAHAAETVQRPGAVMMAMAGDAN